MTTKPASCALRGPAICSRAGSTPRKARSYSFTIVRQAACLQSMSPRNWFWMDATDQAVVFRTRTPPAAWDLEVRSVPERRSLATLPNAGAPVISRDGKFLVFQRLAGDETPAGAWVVWSITNSRIEAEFQIDKQFDTTAVISGNWLIMVSRLGRPRRVSSRSCSCVNSRPVGSLPSYPSGLTPTQHFYLRIADGWSWMTRIAGRWRWRCRRCGSARLAAGGQPHGMPTSFL